MRRPPGSTLTDTRFPDTTLFRSPQGRAAGIHRDPLRVDRWDHGAVVARYTVVDFRWGGVHCTVGGGGTERPGDDCLHPQPARSEEHTSELQSLMRISYAVFCLKKKNKEQIIINKFTESE